MRRDILVSDLQSHSENLSMLSRTEWELDPLARTDSIFLSMDECVLKRAIVTPKVHLALLNTTHRRKRVNI